MKQYQKDQKLVKYPYISEKEILNVLNKKGNNWYVSPEGYPVDSGKIKTMLDVIENLTVTAMVSESKNYDRYDLSDDKKITIKAHKFSATAREKIIQAGGQVEDIALA